MRADARENRDRLLGAARELFATLGPDVSLQAIAERAGVGIGTLYRRFPTREALIEGVYRSEVDALCAAAPELLRELAPDRALAEWMERFVAYAATKRGLSSALRELATAQSELFPATRARLLSTIGMFLSAGQRDGSIRADVGAEDVLRAINAIWAIPESELFAEQAIGVLGLLIDGLRFGAGEGTAGASPAPSK